MVPPVDAYHYDVFRPHMLTSVPGPPPLQPREPGTAGAPRARAALGLQAVPGRAVRPRRRARHRASSPEFLNKGRIASWGNDQFWLFPNLSIQIWARNYYITYTYWPETVDSHIYEIDLYFVPPANAHERLAQELVVDSTIEFAMQDVNTIEATHSALGDPGPEAVPPQRPGAAHPPVPHGHPRHRRRPPGRTEASMSTTAAEGFAELEPYVEDWARPTRAERYAVRLSKPFDELVEFYDAIAPHAEEAIAHLDDLDLDALPDDAARLLHLLYSMILVSYAVNVFHQPRIPDSGRGVLRHGRTSRPSDSKALL